MIGRGYGVLMSIKSERIARADGHSSGDGLNPHYQGFFDCFNRGQYFEAHEVLERLWLEGRHGSNGAFYKGLIQLAAAFVHLQKNRLGPSAALFKMADANLGRYSGTHERLAISEAVALIEQWLGLLQQADEHSNPLRSQPAPMLRLEQI